MQPSRPHTIMQMQLEGQERAMLSNRLPMWEHSGVGWALPPSEPQRINHNRYDEAIAESE